MAEIAMQSGMRMVNLSIRQIMINIQDIQFNKEILPLFDSTPNLFSGHALQQWFLDMPGSVGEILERQDILKGFITNTQLHKPFGYSRTEFNEVYGYMEEFKNRDAASIGEAARLHLHFHRREMQREAGKLSQLMLFLQKLKGFYFDGLMMNSFPEAYRKKIQHILDFMKDLDVEGCQSIVRTGGLRVKHIVRLHELFSEKIKNGHWRFFWEEFFHFEACLSLAKTIIQYGFSFPVFDTGKLSFRGLYHPLLSKAIKNDLEVNDHVLILTGPNMSGKSTLLKSVGICVYLGHTGMAVPAKSAELIFFDAISISTHLKDDLVNGYSHFMTEIRSLKNILELEKSGRKCFAVFDELFKGTNEEDALAISAATIRGLAKSSGSYFLVSTHLHQLKNSVEQNKPGIGLYCMECSLQDQVPVFTYRLLAGWSELKIGQILFRLEGLDKLLPV